MITKHTLSKIVIFAVGAGIGSAVTWYITKTRYEQILQDEIDSVKKTFSVLNETMSNEAANDTDIPDEYYDDMAKKPEYVDPDKVAYDTIIKSAGYSNNKEEFKMPDIYVIPPDEFDECGYETVSLLYHTDGVVSDEFGEIVEYEKLIGDDFMNHYGEYEEDSVFIRNDKLKTDYEILKDYRSYAESK